MKIITYVVGHVESRAGTWFFNTSYSLHGTAVGGFVQRFLLAGVYR